MQYIAKHIFFVAAIVIGGYIGFIVFVVLLAQFISWIKDGTWRKYQKKW